MAEVNASSASRRAMAAAGAPAAVGEVVRLVRRALSFDSTSVKEDWTRAFIVDELERIVEEKMSSRQA
jgi:hypothetical protein